MKVVREVNLKRDDPEGFEAVKEAFDRRCNNKENSKMTVIAKFNCVLKTQRKNWNPDPPYLYEYEFQPVTGGSKENEQFFASTPGGSIKLTAVREDLYVPGKAYYVTFSEAES